MDLPFSNILIYGMGMMGSSLAQSLKKTAPETRITGVVRSGESASYLKKQAIADDVLIQDKAEAIASVDLDQFDLVILGVPPHSIIEMAAHFPQTNTLITDMSSTRRQVQSALAQKPTLRFLGSHPMCGSENKGPQSSLPDLYNGNLCLIIEDKRFANITNTDYHKIKLLWQAVGMECYQITPNEHDQILAYLSHGPHILSSLLTHWAFKPNVQTATTNSPRTITGGGFKSMARIAGSNPEMWSDILETNGDNILESLKQFHATLGELIDKFPAQKTADWHKWFNESRRNRDILCGYENLEE